MSRWKWQKETKKRMSTITFRGARFREAGADLRIKDEAGVFARLQFAADMSKPVQEAMNWEPIPNCTGSTKLTGTLMGRNLVLTPNDKELRKHEIQMEVSEVCDFQLFRTRNGEGAIEKEELRFTARVVEPYATQKVEQYLRTVGTAQGALKIAYEVQEKLPLDPGESKQITLGDGTLATLSRGGDTQDPITEHLKGEVLERHNAVSGAALASSREMQEATRATVRRMERKPQ